MKVYLMDLLPYGQHFDQFKADRFIPYPLPGRHFDPQDRGAHLRRALRGVGGDGPARLRRPRPQRAPHHAARPDGVAEHDRGGRGAGDEEARVADPGQPAAAAQSAAHRGGAGDGGLHQPGPHPARLRPRRAARVSRLRRADVGIARPLRRGAGDHPQGLDRGRVLPRGPVLDIQGHLDLAAALPAAASAAVHPVHRLQGDDRAGRQAQHERGDPGRASRRHAGHRRLLRPSSSRRTRQPADAGQSDASSPTPTSPTASTRR